MDKTYADLLRERARGFTGPGGDPELQLVMINAADFLDKQAKCLRMAADRFDDIGSVMDEGAYNNSGFMRASARRCRQLDF